MSKRLGLSLLLFAMFALFLAMPSAFAGPTIPASQSAITKYYIPFNVVNIAGTATITGFQMTITNLPSSVNALAGNVYVANGISAQILPSWANATNTITFDMLSNTIPAGGSANGIYFVGVGSPNININSAANDIGSYSCATYDSGNIVFQVYDDFCGTSLKSFWALGAGVASATVNNGLTFIVNSASNAGGVWTNTGMRDSGQGTVSYPAKLIADIAQPAASGCSGIDTDGSDTSGSTPGTAGILMSVAQGGWGGASPISSTGAWPNAMSSATYYIASIYTSSSAFILNMNGATMSVGSGGQPTGASFIGNQACGSATSSTVDARYILVAVAPPSNIMPSTTYGSLTQVTTTSINLPASTTYGHPFSVIATCVPSSDSCAVQSPLGTNLATGTGTATYTTTNGAGSPTFYANDLTLQTTASGTLTIAKGAPVITLSNCGNENYGAGPYTCQTDGTLAYPVNNMLVSNQVTGTLWLNSAAVGTTTSTQNLTTNTIQNLIGTFSYTFNTPATANFLANTLSISWVGYVPFTATNGIGTISIGPSQSPYTYNTGFPSTFSVTSPSNALNYSLTQTISSVTNVLVTNSLALDFLPPSNQITGNYVYTLLERQSGNPLTTTLVIAANVFNMVVLKSSAGCQPQFTPGYTTEYEYQPLPINGLVKSCWFSPPNVYYVDRYLNSTTPAANTVITGGWNTNTLPINIEVGYTTLSPALYFNLTPSTGQTVNSLSLNPYSLVLSNTLIPANRLIGNFSVFSQETFNAVSTTLNLNLNGTINGWTINSLINDSGSSQYYLYGSNSPFINSEITYSLNASASTPLYYFQSDTYCPQTSVPGSVDYFPIGLVDTNGSRYTFYVYTAGGGTAGGQIMQIIEQKGVGSTMVQSYQIPATIPFALPLEATGQQYAFDIYNKPCTVVQFKGGLSVPSNPIYLTLNTTTQAYIYNVSKAQGQCKLTSTMSGNYYVTCSAADNTNNVYQYKTYIFKTTSLVGTQTQVFNYTAEGASFIANTILPANTIYTWQIYAYAYKEADPVFSLCLTSCQLGFQPITLAAPLFGLAAFLLMLTLILGGASTGKPIIMLMLANAGLFLVALVGIDIQLSVAVVFLAISCVAVWWDLRH